MRHATNLHLLDLTPFQSLIWRKPIPQLMYANSLLGEIESSISKVTLGVSACRDTGQTVISVVDIFEDDFRRMNPSQLNAQVHPHVLKYHDHLLISTDASVIGTASGAGIFLFQAGIYNSLFAS